MNNHKRRFRPRPQRGTFRKRNNHHGNNNSSPFQNNIGNKSFIRNGSSNNPFSLEKTIQKYQQLAKDALSSGDPILSENYLQHADHFARILSLQEVSKSSEEKNNIIEQNFIKSPKDTTDKKDNITNLENLDTD